MRFSEVRNSSGKAGLATGDTVVLMSRGSPARIRFQRRARGRSAGSTAWKWYTDGLEASSFLNRLPPPRAAPVAPGRSRQFVRRAAFRRWGRLRNEPGVGRICNLDAFLAGLKSLVRLVYVSLYKATNYKHLHPSADRPSAVPESASNARTLAYCLGFFP